MSTEVIYKDLNADDENLAPMEIESMCMNCHENVSVWDSKLNFYVHLGHNKINVHKDSVLQASHCYEFFLRALWLPK
jgi:hypothetical protein